MEPKRVTTNDSDEACALGWEKMDSQELDRVEWEDGEEEAEYKCVQSPLLL